MFLRFNKFTILWAIVILVVTLISGTTDANLESKHTDKWAHVAMFAILSLLMIIGLSKQTKYTNLRFQAVKTSILTSIGYGVLIEILQFSLDYRKFSFLDILANSVGVLLGYGMFYIIYKMKVK